MRGMIKASRDKARPAEHTVAGVWSKADHRALQRSLDPVHNPRLKPLGFLMCPEVSGMLTTQPEAIFDRTAGFLGVVNIMSGLLLSAIAGSGLAPLKVEVSLPFPPAACTSCDASRPRPGPCRGQTGHR